MSSSKPTALREADDASTRRVGIGLIGVGGRLSSLVRRLPGLGNELTIVAVADPDETSVAEAQDEFAADATVYNDYRELVRDPNVEWVMIGSWNNHHREHTIAALEAGKHVFCEKPLATTLEDAVAMRDAQERAGTLFSIGFTLRYSPHYRKIKEIIDSGEIGTIVSFEFNETLDFNHGGFIHGDWRRKTALAGSHLLEKCSHDLDIANWMTESLASRVASFGGLNFFTPENRHHQERVGPSPESGKPAFETWRKRKENENPFTAEKDIIDNQVAIIEYANGVRATFHTNCVAGIPERRMYICGTEGAIRSDVRPGTLEVCRYGWESRIERRDTGVSSDHGGGDEFLTASLANSMLHGNAPPTSIRDGLTSAITAFAIDEAMNRGETIDVAPYWRRAGVTFP